MTKSIKIAGEVYMLAGVYADGDVINANEAAALNQTRAENIRNNFANVVKKASADGGEVPSQEALEEYAANYKFGVRVAGAGADPVKKEMKAIVVTALNAKLSAAGISKKEFGTDAFKKKVASLMEENDANLRAEAEEVIASRAKSVLGDFDI